MAYIKIEVDYQVVDGSELTFSAPCSCTDVNGINVYYPTMIESGTSRTNKIFTFRDAHGNLLTGLENLFAQGAMVKVILDVTNGAAYIQNADTNKYLEDKIASAAASWGGYSLQVVDALPSSPSASVIYLVKE